MTYHLEVKHEERRPAEEVVVVRDCPLSPQGRDSRAARRNADPGTDPLAEHRTTRSSSFGALNLCDFPPLYDGETDASRALRADALRTFWEWVEGRFASVQPDSNRDVFSRLEFFARKHHTLKGQPAGRIPTAVVYAGGLNPSDHTATLSALASFLRGKGAFVARVRGRDVTHSRGLAAVASSVLGQFCGTASDVDDVDGVAEWYGGLVAKTTRREGVGDKGRGLREEGRGRKEGGGVRRGGAAKVNKFLAGSLGKRRSSRLAAQRTDKAPVERHNNGRAQAEGGETPTTPVSAKLGLSSRPSDEMGGMGHSEQLEARPLVVVIETGENADARVLRDLILALSESRTRLPVSLIFTMCTDVAALQRLLPSEAASRVSCQHMALATSRQCIEEVFKRVLLAQVS